MVPPFELCALDAQLSIVELHDGCPPNVDPDLCASVLQHRDVIEALRKGVQTRRWNEDAMPYSVTMLAAVPGLLRLPPDAAAAIVAAQQKVDGPSFCGDESVAGIKRRVHLANFKTKLVASIRKRARESDQ